MNTRFNIRTRTLILCSTIISLYSCAFPAPVKVACAGTSITAFFKYPDKLQTLLGSNYTVGNFGESGATALFTVQYWRPQYIKSPQLDTLIMFKPDIVVIELGANDLGTSATGSLIWNDSANFIGDYSAILDTISRRLGYALRFFLCLPTAQSTTADQRNPTIISGGIVPRVRQIAATRHLPLIDLFTPFNAAPQTLLGSDGLHPSPAGADTIANRVYHALTATVAAVPSTTHSFSARPMSPSATSTGQVSLRPVSYNNNAILLSGRRAGIAGSHPISTNLILGFQNIALNTTSQGKDSR